MEPPKNTKKQKKNASFTIRRMTKFLLEELERDRQYQTNELIKMIKKE